LCTPWRAQRSALFIWPPRLVAEGRRRPPSGAFLTGQPDNPGDAKRDGTVRIWDADVTQQESDHRIGHQRWVNSLAIGKVGDKEVVSGSGDGTVRIWDAQSGRPTGGGHWCTDGSVMCSTTASG
jgi:WD40 repeat protein